MIDHDSIKVPARVPQGVRLATIADVPWLWEKVKTQHSIFFEPTEDDSTRFAELIAHPGTHAFIIDDGALMFVSDLDPQNMAFFNGVVWDEKLYGQQARAKEMLQFLFRLFGLHRMSAVVPQDNPLGRNFVKSLGFRQEADFREAVRRADGRVNLAVFGILRSEVMDNGGSSSTVHRRRRWRFAFWSHKPERGAQEPALRRHREYTTGSSEILAGLSDPGSGATRNGRFKSLLGFAWPRWRRPR